MKDETFYDRLIQEKLLLDDKIMKLTNFMKSDKIKTIDSNQISLMGVQLSSMKTYSMVLTSRINLINK